MMRTRKYCAHTHATEAAHISGDHKNSIYEVQCILHIPRIKPTPQDPSRLVQGPMPCQCARHAPRKSKCRSQCEWASIRPGSQAPFPVFQLRPLTPRTRHGALGRGAPGIAPLERANRSAAALRRTLLGAPRWRLYREPVHWSLLIADARASRGSPA